MRQKFVSADRIDVRNMACGDDAGHLLKLLRTQVARWRIDEIARQPNTLHCADNALRIGTLRHDEAPGYR